MTGIQALASETGLASALEILQPALEYAGTIAFAISGALVAARKRMDLVGVVVLGCMVAVGGGTIRDLVLGRTPVFWVADPSFVVVAAITALLTLPLYRRGVIQWGERYRVIQVSDAAGLALFVVTGTNVALRSGASDLSAALIGVVSGVGGGIIRDVLAAEVPEVLRSGQFYATAALGGALVYVGLLHQDAPKIFVFWVPIVLILGIRLMSLRRGWGVPVARLEPKAPRAPRSR